MSILKVSASLFMMASLAQSQNNPNHIVDGDVTGLEIVLQLNIAPATGLRHNKDFKEMMSNDQKYVLLVEDNEIAVKIGKRVFQELGCNVDVATDGKTAVEMAIRNDYNIISMDIGLPIMNGMEACRAIREYESQHPERTPVPIVAVSANTGEEETKQYIAAGMQYVIPKPFGKADGEKLLTFCTKKNTK